MKVSIIICTLKRPQSVERLLKSIRHQSVLPDQLIIVDASDDHDTEEVVNKYSAPGQNHLEYYRSERGLTRQRNFGLSKANGDIIGFFDDDVVLEEGYLAEILKPFQNDAAGKIGGATGYIQVKNIERSRLHRFFGKFRSSLYGPRCLARHYGIKLIPQEPFTETIPIRYVSGCNMFFRRQVFDKYKFSEWFEGYGLGEDREFGLRVSRDWQIMAVGTARLWHLHELSGRPNYKKLGRMCIENPVKILPIARDNHLYSNSFMLIFRQFLGIFITSMILINRKHFADAINHIYGGFLGLIAAIRHVGKNLKF